MSSFDTLVDMLVDPEMLQEQLIETYDPVSHWELCLHFMYTLCEQQQDTHKNETNVYYKTYTDTGDAYLLNENQFQEENVRSHTLTLGRSSRLAIRDYVFHCHRHIIPQITAHFLDGINNDFYCSIHYSVSDVSYCMKLTETRRNMSIAVYGPKRHVRNAHIIDIFTDMCRWLKQTSTQYSPSQIDEMSRQGQHILYCVTL